MKHVNELLLSCVCIGFAIPIVMGASASAQAPAPAAAAARPAAPAATRIALIDVSHIFKNHAGFKQKMEGLKADADAFQSSLQERAKDVQAMHKQMTDFKKGSPEYEKLEEQIAELQSKYQLEMNLKKKGFMDREAQIHFEVYGELKQAVTQYATLFGYEVVIRFSRDEIDPEDRGSVLSGINQPLVFHDPKNDITVPILDYLNRESGPRSPRVSAQPSGARAAAPGARPAAPPARR